MCEDLRESVRVRVKGFNNKGVVDGGEREVTFVMETRLCGLASWVNSPENNQEVNT